MSNIPRDLPKSETVGPPKLDDHEKTSSPDQKVSDLAQEKIRTFVEVKKKH